MARSRASYLKELSTTDLKQLLAARQRIDVLEKEKTRLVRELDAIESELTRLVAGVEKPRTPVRRKKAVRKKAMVKTSAHKTTKKKTAKKTVASKGKKATKKVVKKTAPKARKKTTKKTAKKTTKKVTKKAAKKPVKKVAAPVRLEDVVVGIITRAGNPVAYQDIMATIKNEKLFTSRSSNFDNVLRRTLSTSKKVKRAGRGVYALA